MLKKLKFRRSWVDHFAASQDRLIGKRILEIGAGPVRRTGVMTMDILESVKPDILHDMEKTPWPLPSESVDAIFAFSVLEHVHAPLDMLAECHRVLAGSGRLFILVPHFSSAASFIDPTHKRHLSFRSFDYVIKGTDLERNYGFYRNERFEIKRRLISLGGIWGKLPFVQSLINNRAEFWEESLCYLIRGQGIYFELSKS